ncbi:hypothetical protein [Parendozoicomonas sp. Alg238-R29]|uniref:hypothetical protein n=1 Tax=Parendozoicomonas sp. Alg238-R29 TaxID=2993446 RepID=UPI00248D7F1E|nr:hypothetical protein [Parendozoicomonas sp. Alg238-R29]
MKAIYKNDFWKVSVDWKDPTLYEDVLENGHECCEDSQLYMITAAFGKNKHKILYIGKTTKSISHRLKQPDHKLRHLKMSGDYSRHKLYITMGKIRVEGGKVTPKRIDQIESLLIYSFDDFHKYNGSKINKLNLSEHYEVQNKGEFHALPEKIYLGLFKN